MGVSSGVLLFHLAEITNPEKFIREIRKHLEDEWNQHNLFTSEQVCSMTKFFLDQNEESKGVIKSFLEEFLGKAGEKAITKESYGKNILTTLQKLSATYAEVPQEFLKFMNDIITETSNINWHTNEILTNNLFDFFLDPSLEKTTNKETLPEEYEKARQLFAIDELALQNCTDTSLPIRWNFNPRNLFPRIFTGNEAAKGYPTFLKMREELIKNKQIRDDVYTNAKDIMIFHFDGTIKPWNTEILANAIKADPEIEKIQEFYNKLKKRTLTLDDINEFRAFLSNIADERLEAFD